MLNNGNHKNALLNELTSIIAILDEAPSKPQKIPTLNQAQATTQDIPLLEDMVVDKNKHLPDTLLDLDRIFSDGDFPPFTAINESKSPPYSTLGNGDEEQSEMFPILEDILSKSLTEAQTSWQVETTQQNSSRKANYHDNLELMVQELVDEFIPLLETRLREQLSALAPHSIRELAEKHLKN